MGKARSRVGRANGGRGEGRRRLVCGGRPLHWRAGRAGNVVVVLGSLKILSEAVLARAGSVMGKDIEMLRR